jgi:acyl-CoA thioesterase-1
MNRHYREGGPEGQSHRLSKPWVSARIGAVVLAGLLCLGLLGSLAASAVAPEPLTRATGDFNPAYESLRSTAVLIGDSQTFGSGGISGDQTWVQKAFSSLGYRLVVNAVGGIGYVSGTAKDPNYPDALDRGKWSLPKPILPSTGSPLIVVQGGGNDARIGSSNAVILANAARLLDGLRKRYPESKIVLIGVLGKGVTQSPRRAQVDELLADFAKSRGLLYVSVADWVSRFGMEKNLLDGVHLDATGHRVIGEVLRDRLRDLGVTGPTAF